VKVVLNGLGGDELFGGYPYYGWEKRWQALQLANPALQALKHVPYVNNLAGRLSGVGEIHSAVDFPLGIRSILPEVDKKKLFLSKEVQKLDSIQSVHDLYVSKDQNFDDFQEALSYMDLMNYIGNHHVHHVDQLTMRFSIEARVPFLDHELVEAAFRVPSQFKMRQGQNKFVLREVAKKYIDPSCLEMKKKGFRFPNSEWMKGPLHNMIKEKLALLSKRDIFSPREIEKTFKTWMAGFSPHRNTWQLVATEIWLEKFID
jgi:asparagine synthase (glutamine-hydrolysing)